MPQIFSKGTNTLSRVSLSVLLIGLLLSYWMISKVYTSPYFTQVRVIRDQPVPFSHEHHVAGLGLDCRYCHTSVETSAFAGMPTASTCMNCHSKIWPSAKVLNPVREAYYSNKPLAWTRVHDLPDFVYFNHSIHVKKGVQCVDCHGHVETMPLLWKEKTLYMEWCLECHRNPSQKVHSDQVLHKRTDCYACHR